MCGSTPCEEPAQALAGAQPPAEVRHHLLPHASWPMNVTRPSAQHAARGGLADVVQERAEAQRLPARRARRRAAPPAAASSRAASSPKSSLQVALELDLLGAAPRACGRTRPGGGSGSAPRRAGRPARAAPTRGRPSRSGELEPVQHALGATTSRRSSANTRSGERLAHPRRRLAREPLGVRDRARSRARRRGAPGAAGAAGRPRRPSGRATQHADDPRLEVARRRRGGRCSSPPSSGTGHRVHGEVAAREVRLDRRRPWSGGDVVDPVALADRAPARRRTPRRAGRPARPPPWPRLARPRSGSPATARSTSRDRPAEQRVAHAAADDPGLAGPARQRLAHRAHGGLARRTLAQLCHCRRTRGLSPHVIS